MDMLKKRVERAFQLTYDLIDHLDQEALGLRLGSLPSNSIGEQAWCIIGARESYLKAVELGQWSGFSCSLKDTKNKNQVLASLERTNKSALEMMALDLKDNQLEYLLDLLEHEIQHHGQLIRFVYGNKLSFPESWHGRYTV
ncbi:hypothetical protein EZV73_07605 [Acidaminobacter sp. JC074]|uniref:hypothetical protein n=1 Tax=Acidaminobacter sp. JC074 TaxID=2530199 RepID=UPI001F0EF345|nr:hypothetical protein [Acidaminobacter sp. JC074]MCH4887431.1 hypothetical protein [Acidaminobacter sp. JC074]